jgi:hypothetical protein
MVCLQRSIQRLFLVKGTTRFLEKYAMTKIIKKTEHRQPTVTRFVLKNRYETLSA